MKKMIAAAAALLAGVAMAAVPELSVDYADIDNGDLSAKLTWDGSAAVTVERALSENGPWQTMVESSTGTWTDPATTVSLTYWYRLNDGTETGTAKKFVAVRKILPSEGTLVNQGSAYNGSSWGGGLPSNAFDGNAYYDNQKFVDIDNYSKPKVGIDFGSASYIVAFVRFFPRTQSNAADMSSGSVVYGSMNDGSKEMATDDPATALTDPTVFAKGDRDWQVRWVNATAAYRTYYYQGSENGCIDELEFYGWTQDEAVDVSPVAPIDAVLSLNTIVRSDLENYYPVLSWKVVNCPVTIQRKIADGAWTTITTAAALANSYIDNTQLPLGKVLSYRLKAGSGANAIANYSNIQTFRRLRRLNTDGYAKFCDGKSESEAAKAFDGGLGTIGDSDHVNCPDSSSLARVGVDFGLATNYVSLVRFYPRNDYYSMRLSFLRLYGSVRSDQNGPQVSVGKLGAVEAYDKDHPEQISMFKWYELDVSSDEPYRCYYACKPGDEGEDGHDKEFYGNVGEIELYGWSMEDVGESLPELNVDFKVSAKFEGSGVQYADYTGVLSWDSTLDSDAQILYLQRSPSVSGPWSNILAVSNESSYEDADAQYGWLWYYRLVGSRNNETIYSPVVSWRRFRKLNAASYSSSYIQSGNLYDNNGTGNIFDDNVNSYLDMYSPWRAGVDFGSATNAVGIVRAYPRSGWTYRLVGSKLYGSQNDFKTINGGDYQHANADTVFGVVAASDQELIWYECMTGFTEFCRSYYISDFYEFGNVAELQLYGWSLDDCPDATPAVTGVVNGDNLVLTATRNPAYDGTNVTFYVHSYGPKFKPYLDEATSAGTVAFENGTASVTVPLVYGAKTTFWAVVATGESASGDIAAVPDTATYTWKAEATGEKQWEDAANWTCGDATKTHLGYPGYLDTEHANVSFNDANNVEVSLSYIYSVRQLWIANESSAQTITFKGNGATKSGILCSGGDSPRFRFGANKNVTFEAMCLTSDTVSVGNNTSLTLSNGAECSTLWQIYVCGENASIHVDVGSTLDVGTGDGNEWYGLFLNGRNAWIDCAGTIKAPRFRIGCSGRGAQHGNPQAYAPKGVTFRGSAPAFIVRNEIMSINEYNDGNMPVFEFIVPEGGYSAAPLRAREGKTYNEAYQMLGDYYWQCGETAISSASSVAFAVSPDSPFYASDGASGGSEMPLVSWPVYNSDGHGGGINTARAVLESGTGVAGAVLEYTLDENQIPVGIKATLKRKGGISFFVR